jgi:exodeoxyribonuclease VII large subunit
VVSAIGHETDFTIADQVADVRAPTPSAAAELVVPDRDALRRRVAELADHSHRAVVYQLDGRKAALAGLLRRMESGLPNVEVWRRRVDDLGRGVHSGAAGHLRLARSRVEDLEHRLKALDPAATLRRGFSVVQIRASGQVVTSTAQVAVGDPLSITVADGLIPATAGANAARKKRKPPPKAPLMERLL